MVNYFISDRDESYDSKLSKYLESISKIHWTPVAIIEEVKIWLDQYHAKNVLDVGSGVGKFCLLAGENTKIKFTGVEIREHLHLEANKLKKQFNADNVSFIHADITTISLRKYDAIYYYHPFCEQLAEDNWIDNELVFSKTQFDIYESYVINELIQCKKGTLFISYAPVQIEMPNSFILEDMNFDGLLQLWIKK